MRISILQQCGGLSAMLQVINVESCCVTLAIFVFPVTSESLSQLISIGIFVHPVCMMTVLCVSPYIVTLTILAFLKAIKCKISSLMLKSAV